MRIIIWLKLRVTYSERKRESCKSEREREGGEIF